MSEAENITFNNNGEDVEMPLADIANIDMSQVEEVRFEHRPAGMYHMKVIGAEIKALGKETPKPAAVIECEVQNCFSTVDGSDPSLQIGKSHRETFFMSDGDGIGRLKAFLTDSGFQGQGTMQAVLDAFHGHEFDAVIKHKKDKNDTDRVYANFAAGKVKPHLQETAPAPAAGGLNLGGGTQAAQA